jgi:hypothetical protein
MLEVRFFSMEDYFPSFASFASAHPDEEMPTPLQAQMPGMVMIRNKWTSQRCESKFHILRMLHENAAGYDHSNKSK